MIRLRFSTILVLALIVASGAVFATPPRHDFPRVGDWIVLCGDFHMHTINSDGKLTTRERVEESYNFGYDVIAVTDHGKPSPYRVAKYVGEPLGLIIIPGFETGILGKEHYVALGVAHTFKPRDSHHLAEKPGEKTVFYQDEMQAIAQAGGILFCAHPPKEWREPTDWGVKNGIIIGTEIQNGYGKIESTGPFGGVNCYPHSFEWALKYDLALFANSDIHHTRRVGPQPVTLVFVSERSADGVMEAIRARRTVAWFNDVVCGREELLSQLVKSAVEIKKSGPTRISLENLCPIKFKLSIGDKTLELPAYGHADIDWVGNQQIRIKWLNVWTSLTTNLETAVELGTAVSNGVNRQNL